MRDAELTALSDQELLERKKKAKSNEIMNAVLCGVLIGIAIYSTVKNGFKVFTVLPLFFVFSAINNRNKSKAIEQELNSRNLK